MSPTSTDTTILFPGALGDFLCLWPSLQALADSISRPIRVFAKPAWLDLLEPERFERFSIDRREIADLFAAEEIADATRALFDGATEVHSWTGHGDERFAARLAAASGGAVHVHRFRGMAPGEHAAQYFARCLSVRPVTRPLRPPAEAEKWAADLWDRHALGERCLAVHPGSGSARKNWEGTADVACRWRSSGAGRVLLLSGPAEEEWSPSAPFDAHAHNQRLDRVAALLRRAHRYLGNDSGVSHLAGLAGCRGVVLFGPSDPDTWGPLGGRLCVVRSERPCATCGPDRFCVDRAPAARVEALLR